MSTAAATEQQGQADVGAILVGEGIQRRFGGLTAVDVDRLRVPRRQVLSLIGPNGAGKSTLFNILSGFDRPQRGKWFFEGQPQAGRPASAIARSGLVRTFQHTRILARATVLENVRLAARDQIGESLWQAPLPMRWRRQEAKIDGRARTLLHRFGLADVQDLPAGNLSGGQRKLLELTRAVMVRPTLLMLDEPMAGVNPVLRETLLGHIAQLRSEGMTIFVIEHDMEAVARISDRVICMAEGRIIADGSAEAVRNHPAVIDAYLGRRRERDAAPDARPRVTAAAPAFEAVDLVSGYLPGIDILRGCTIEAREGELVGVFGPNGAGKSTLLKAVFGQAQVRGGGLRLAGESVVGVPPHDLVARGIGYVPQVDNVFATLTVEENLRMGLFQRPRDWSARRAAMLERFPTLEQLLAKRAGDLSGGERKVVAFGRALVMAPQVLLLDEPSAGLSPVRQDELFEMIVQINRTGVTIVIVEQNARQCLQICDRGYVLDRGCNAFSGSSAELLHDPKVIELYLGGLGAPAAER